MVPIKEGLIGKKEFSSMVKEKTAHVVKTEEEQNPHLQERPKRRTFLVEMNEQEQDPREILSYFRAKTKGAGWDSYGIWYLC